MASVDFAEPHFTVRFEGLNRETENVKAWSIESGYTISTDGFEFTLYDPRRENLRDLWMQPVELLIDGNSQLLGRIEVVEQGSDGTAVTCRGRDYLADLVEGTVDPTLKIKQEMTLEAAILLAAGPYGIDTVTDDDDIAMRNIRTGVAIGTKKRATKKHKQKLDEYKPHPDEGLYAFLNRLVARQAATIQPGNARNVVVLTAPQYAQEPAYTLTRRIDDPTAGNRILSATSTRDGTSIPTYTIAAGKGGAAGEAKSALAMKFATSKVAEALGGELGRLLGPLMSPDRILPGTTKPAGLLYRLLCQRDEDSKNQEQVERIALRAFAERFKETLVYRATMRGIADPETRAVYSTDTIAKVADEVCDVDENLWIASRRLGFSEGQGVTTELECWRPGSYLIDDGKS